MGHAIGVLLALAFIGLIIWSRVSFFTSRKYKRKG
jgi:hypothetical protein